ncbi:MAG: tyrosine-type recombinase/integrase [Actinobacteria bacterium]|nr:tyrosine-type recombinase/integrase [Actinomycetota bacterium]
MSPLQAKAGDYLRLRRALGHKLDDAGRQLAKFVVYLDDIGAETVTVENALGFVLDPDLDPATMTPARRLTAVRGFARYLAGMDPLTEIPPAGLVSWRARRRTPWVFSDEDVAALIRSARASTPSPFRAATLTAMIGLLAVSGMRVGEAIRLNRGDVDWDDAVVLVRGTKFMKGRNVPVSPTTIDALAAYARLRDTTFPEPRTTWFFVSLGGGPVAYSHFQATFRKAVVAAGIGAGSPIRPRVHDLRHAFAVRTLLGWYRADLDVDALLPRLSTYLGHREPRFTYGYLTATPELLGCAAARLEAVRSATP